MGDPSRGEPPHGASWLPLTVLTDPRCLNHRVSNGMPERPERLGAVLDAIEAFGVKHPGAIRYEEPGPATREQLARVHTAGYLDRLESLRGRTGEAGPEAPVSDGSVLAAELAAGAVVRAVELARAGCSRVLCAVRPPGHHAEADHGLGFCLLSSVAVGAWHAVESAGFGRVLIVDVDVHHGNGTQHTTEHDPRIGLVDLHQDPLYPGTGAAGEIGVGAGLGTVWNAPMPPGCGDADYLAVLGRVLPRAMERMVPGLVLVSLGFDAHLADPLGSMRVTSEGFGKIVGLIGQHADRAGGVPVVLSLEGGYDLGALAGATRSVLGALVRRVPDSAPINRKALTGAPVVPTTPIADFVSTPAADGVVRSIDAAHGLDPNGR